MDVSRVAEGAATTGAGTSDTTAVEFIGEARSVAPEPSAKQVKPEVKLLKIGARVGLIQER